MEDYEVRDVSRRSESPNLFIKMELSEASAIPGKNNVGLRVLVGNTSPMPAEYAVIQIFIDSRINILYNREFTILPPQINVNQIECFSTENCWVNRLAYNWSVGGGQMPIWEGLTFKTADPYIDIDLPNMNTQYKLYWTVRSPKMEIRNGSNIIDCAGGQISIS
jgi:hypothetical protein